jgi:hypothetical protein
MFRGEPPSSSNFALDNVDYKLFYTKYGEFKITELKLMPQKIIVADENKRVSFLIKIKQENKKIFEKKISVGAIKNETNLDGYHPYSEANPTSLILDIVVFYQEKFANKISNFINCHENSKIEKKLTAKILVPERSVENQQFEICLLDKKNNEYKLSIIFNVTRKIEKSLNLTFIKEPFIDIRMFNFLNEYLMFDDLKYKDFDGHKGDALRAQHRALVKHGNGRSVQLFTVDILHIASQQWSSVKIMQNNDVLATSHLVSSAQLPLLEQVNKDSQIFTLDPKYEKSMLIRNLNGDYALLKGKWVTTSGGSLKVSYYSFARKSLNEVMMDQDALFFRNENISAKINLKSSQIELNFLKENNKLEAVSILAVILSMTVLYVLLKPKPKPYLIKNSQKYLTIEKKECLDKYTLLSLIGVTELISSSCFFYNYADKPSSFFKNDGWLFAEIEKPIVVYNCGGWLLADCGGWFFVLFF